MPRVDESSDGREVELPVGLGLEIRQSERPTTGFRWRLESDGRPACVLVGNSFQPASDRPGGGRTHRWQFRGAQPGAGLIELRYRRSWEGQAEAARTFTLHIRVTR